MELCSMPKAIPSYPNSVPGQKKLSPPRQKLSPGRKILSPVRQKLSPGQTAGDAKIVVLFRDWLVDRSHATEKEIIATPADSAPAVAIKSYLVLYSRLDCAYSDDRTLRCPVIFEAHP